MKHEILFAFQAKHGSFSNVEILKIKLYLVNRPDTDALMNATERFKDKQSCIFNEIIQTGDQEEVIDQHLL